MPRTKTTTYTVDIAARPHGYGDLPGFLDMLVYEGARVISYAEINPGTVIAGYRVTLQSEHYVPRRWDSFGITPVVKS